MKHVPDNGQIVHIKKLVCYDDKNSNAHLREDKSQAVVRIFVFGHSFEETQIKTTLSVP